MPKEPPKAEPAHEAPSAAVLPQDATLKDVLMSEVRPIHQRISNAVREKLELIVVNAVPQFPKVSLILGVLAVGAGVAIPLGLYGMTTTLMAVLPLALVGAFLGYGMRS